MTDINIDEYLEDLQTNLDNGEGEKMYWQEDMQVLISELKETRKQLKKLENKNKDLLRKLRNRVKEVKKLTKYSLYKKEFSRLRKEIEKKDKIIDLMAENLIGIIFNDENNSEIMFENIEDIKQYFERKVEKMTIEKKLEKKINTIIQLSGEYPKEVEVTKEEYKQIGQDSFMGVKLKIKD